MAKSAYITARRDFLAAGLVAIAASGAGPAIATTPATAWDHAFTRRVAAGDAEMAFQNQRYNPADVASVNSGTPISSHIEAEMDRLADEADTCAWAMLATPAPNGAALRVKLDHLLKGEGLVTAEPWTRDRLKQVHTDIARLLGDA
jgi:hypothetical protein